MNRTEVAIAGGGIIGLSAALELAAAGRQVTVFERGQSMSEASWAAAGMLAADDPENPAELGPLSRLSRALYPQFLEHIRSLSGMAIPIRTTQTIQGADEIPHGFFELDSASLHTLAPGLAEGELKFFLIEEQSLSPRDLAEALPKAVGAAGVHLIEQCSVSEVRDLGDSIEMHTSKGAWQAETVIYAAGAWTEPLTGIAIPPRKGQMLEVKMRPDTDHQLQVVLRTPEIYLVPRGDGRIVIGATVEDAGYDKQVSPPDLEQLLQKAEAVWPSIRQSSIVESWAGLRPGSPDHLPCIGNFSSSDRSERRSSSERPHQWIAAGHFRNGILLAPGTARLLRQMILGETPSVDPTLFRCDRFACSSVE